MRAGDREEQENVASLKMPPTPSDVRVDCASPPPPPNPRKAHRTPLPQPYSEPSKAFGTHLSTVPLPQQHDTSFYKCLRRLV